MKSGVGVAAESSAAGIGGPRATTTLIFCLVVLAAVGATALFAPLIAPSDPNAIDTFNRLLPPLTDKGHWLGTDNLGRDIFSRLIYGGRTSLVVGLIAMSFALVFGVTLGLLAASVGGWLDDVVSWLVNVQLSIPAIVLAISISAVLGNGIANVIFAIGITLWPQFARITRGSALKVLQLPYVEGAVAIGAGRLRIALRHVLPNIASSLIVIATLELGHAIVSEAALAFLGFGVEPRRPSWGTMIADGRPYLSSAVWLTLLPSLALSLTTVAISYLGDEIDPSARH